MWGLLRGAGIWGVVDVCIGKVWDRGHGVCEEYMCGYGKVCVERGFPHVPPTA